MNSVLIAAKCNRCEEKYDEIFVMRDLKGIPSCEGMVCQKCGNKNCLTRDYQGGVASTDRGAFIPADGEVHRFEYSYRDDSGKVHNKKMDGRSVQKHALKNS